MGSLKEFNSNSEPSSSGKDLDVNNPQKSSSETFYESASPSNSLNNGDSKGTEEISLNETSLPIETLNVSTPAQESIGEGDWTQLLGKIKGFLGDGFFGFKDGLFLPATFVLTGLIASLILFKAYLGLLAGIARIPLASSVFEVTGTIWLIRFAQKRLIRSEDRQLLIDEITNRWASFLGN